VSNIVLNISKGRVVELYNRVKANDPANSALILVPIETTGLEADSVLIDKDDLAAVLSGATNEPTVTWTAAAGNAISKILVCYDSDTTSGTDANILPLTLFDFAITPSGADVQMTGGVFFRAS
jgi:hypothetical protein